jgi:hypothetical protein
MTIPSLVGAYVTIWPAAGRLGVKCGTGTQPTAGERKEVIGVKYFKITKTWAVKAESEAEAIKLALQPQTPENLR